MRIRTALWVKQERKLPTTPPTPRHQRQHRAHHAGWLRCLLQLPGLVIRLGMSFLPPQVWLLPGLLCWDTGPKRLSECSDQRGSLDSILKVCGSMRGGQSTGIYSQGSPALNPTWHRPGCTSTPAGQSPLEQEQSIAKDNLGEGWLNNPLPCPVGCPSGTFLTSKISAHMIFSICRPQRPEAQQMGWAVSHLKTVTRVGSIFLTY